MVTPTRPPPPPAAAPLDDDPPPFLAVEPHAVRLTARAAPTATVASLVTFIFSPCDGCPCASDARGCAVLRETLSGRRGGRRRGGSRPGSSGVCPGSRPGWWSRR